MDVERVRLEVGEWGAGLAAVLSRCRGLSHRPEERASRYCILTGTPFCNAQA
jgi:hypothetical protein